MPTLVIPSVRWGKRKKRSQMTEVHTEDRRIEIVEMDVMRSCIDNPEKGMGFLLDGGNQYRSEDGNWCQILWERTLYPVSSVKKREESNYKDLLLQIYREAKALAKQEQYKKMNQNRMNTFLWVVSIFCGTFIIIAGIRWLGG